MDEFKLQNLIRQEIEAYMNNKQFNISKISNHEHNGVDSNPIPVYSIIESLALPGSKTPDVFSSLNLNNQVVVQGNSTKSFGTQGTVKQGKFFTLPIPVIYGNGVGVNSAFNGGDAPVGTILFFDNGLTLSGFWVKTISGWYGFTPDSLI